MQSVRGEVNLFAMREQILSENEKTPLITTTNMGQIVYNSGLEAIELISPVT